MTKEVLNFILVLNKKLPSTFDILIENASFALHYSAENCVSSTKD